METATDIKSSALVVKNFQPFNVVFFGLKQNLSPFARVENLLYAADQVLRCCQGLLVSKSVKGPLNDHQRIVGVSPGLMTAQGMHAAIENPIGSRPLKGI